MQEGFYATFYKLVYRSRRVIISYSDIRNYISTNNTSTRFFGYNLCALNHNSVYALVLALYMKKKCSIPRTLCLKTALVRKHAVLALL